VIMMNKEEDVAILIRTFEHIFGINESDPDEAIKFKEFRKVLSKYFKIEVLK
jgi:hypothetical protein